MGRLLKHANRNVCSMVKNMVLSPNSSFALAVQRDISLKSFTYGGYSSAKKIWRKGVHTLYGLEIEKVTPEEDIRAVRQKNC